MSEELIKRLRKWAKSDLGLIVMYEAADTIEAQAAEIAEYRRQHCSAVEIARPLLDTIEAQAAEIERWREAFAPGLNDDGTCDDHGDFGCRVCVSPRQARAALRETE